jgi:hypothetical protein
LNLSSRSIDQVLDCKPILRILKLHLEDLHNLQVSS